MNDLVKVKDSRFGTVACDYYGNGKGEFFMTRLQIGQALEYKRPQWAIDKIHAEHKKRLDQFSTTSVLGVVEGGRAVQREVFLYSARGVYEICRWSRQPKADEFYDHVYDILEGLRLGYLKLSAERQTESWKTARTEGKAARRMETDAVKMFVEYAARNGSTSPDKYYVHFSKMADAAVGIAPGQRDNVPTGTLLDLKVVEQIIDRAIRSELATGTEYHKAYQNVRAKVQQVSTLAFAPPLALPGTG